MKHFFSVIFFLLCAFFCFSQQTVYYNGHPIEDKKVIVKIDKNQLKNQSSQDVAIDEQWQKLQTYVYSLGAKELKQNFPQVKLQENCTNCVDISTIYSFTYASDIAIEKVISNLKKMPFVVYAEPSYVGELLYVPNDTEYEKGNLWHLKTCKVVDAWDIEKGDSTVVVAIVDGGIDIIQSDLINRIAYNYNDPINGIDDDGDGYIDNYRGWDIADDDCNPSNATIDHGTYVAGISNAEVDNEFGTAGVGFNTKFLPIKVCKDGSGEVTGGYNGIVYAANQGCRVINCSWGDQGGSQYGQDIVNYATFNCNALVVASAGNSAATTALYPASYDNVLSVAGTVAGDYVWADSDTKGTNYNEFVDICAPAKGYYSVAANDNVIAMSGGGTSFSAPIVAGAAALVASKFPNDSALQIAERLRVTADDLYEMNSEEIYQNRLGQGRVNVYKALTVVDLPSIRKTSVEVVYPTRQKHVCVGDTITIKILLKNYLASSSNISISATCENNFVDIVNQTQVFETWEANEEKEIQFSCVAQFEPALGYTSFLTLSYSNDNGYSATENILFDCNRYYYDFEFADLRATATSDGSIAVYEVGGDENGFSYKDFDNCIYQAGLILAENQSSIYCRNSWRNDFIGLQYPLVLDDEVHDISLYSRCIVDDFPIEEYVYAQCDTNALIYELYVYNQRDTSVANLRLGAFIDWDILNSPYNQIWYIDSLQLSVAKSTDPRSYYVGWQSLDENPVGIYSFDVASDVIYYNDGFNNNELWYALNNNQFSAGKNTVLGCEAATFNHVTIDTIQPQDSCLVRFALLAADTEEELCQLASQLKQQYNPTKNDEDTTLAISSFLDKYVRLSVVKDEVNILYEKSIEPIQISTFTIMGQRVSAITIYPSEQEGNYKIPSSKGQWNIVKVEREGQLYVFKYNSL